MAKNKILTIEDLIKDRDYDLIEYRLTLPKSCGGGNALFGYCKSENGPMKMEINN